MALFRNLTMVDGTETFVNVDLITNMRRIGDYTLLNFDEGNAVSVKETPGVVLAGLGPDRWPKPAS